MKKSILLLLCAQGILHAASGSSNSFPWLDDKSKASKQRIVFRTAMLSSGELTIETTMAAVVLSYHAPKPRSFAMETWSDSEDKKVVHALGITASGDQAMFLTTIFAEKFKQKIKESPTLAVQDILNQTAEYMNANSLGLETIMGILIHANKRYSISGFADSSTPKTSMPKLTLSEGKIEKFYSIGGGALPTICWNTKQSL